MVNTESLRKNKFAFMVQLNLPTTVVDTWPYYEFEDYIKLLNEKNDKEREQQEKEEKNQQSKIPKMGDLSALTKNFSPSSFKLPSFPKF